ncbi:uncharacterized protein LOC114332210 isoform X1 [Diabrotica virgifera virgifera]|uniref:Uncharacterized protein LOC114332210 isoform X1 n=1 Tax=Diabrotica virgifera virgifera TaxID=50390 RepID=A0A6P7FSJ5_DIAVI|nr:uncharacterized protein LOC114332210 isoform X1 [Diabrotica virgifera virgifera]
MDNLPAEILMQILQYVETFDLIQLCRIEKFKVYLKERNLISICDLSKRYESSDMNLFMIIKYEMDRDFIKVLNINGIYWIPAEKLRKLIISLNNLEELQVIDTKLGFSDTDTELYEKLKKLAVCVDRLGLMASKEKRFKSLKMLFLKFICNKVKCSKVMEVNNTTADFTYFIRINHQLEELWVEDMNNLRILPASSRVISHKNLKKIVSRIGCYDEMMEWDRLLNDDDDDYAYHPSYFPRLTFRNMELDINNDIIYKNFKPTVPRPHGDCWLSFQTFYNNKPCGPTLVEFKFSAQSIKNNKIYELALHPCCTHPNICNPPCKKEAQEILKSENCVELRRLRLTTDILDEIKDDTTETKEDSLEVTFKKRRVGVSEESGNNFFEEISQHLKFLVELEITSGKDRKMSPSVLNAFASLPNFTNLQRLSMFTPPLLSGSFFPKFFQDCTQLKSLNIEMKVPNIPFMTNLFSGLKYATQLRDLRLDVPSINMERLMIELCNIPTKKLLRLVIISHIQDTNQRTQAIYEDFFQKNPQLVLFYVIPCPETSKYIYKIINDIKKVYKKGHQKENVAKIIYISEKDHVDDTAFAHFDFIKNIPQIGRLNFDAF